MDPRRYEHCYGGGNSGDGNGNGNGYDRKYEIMIYLFDIFCKLV